MDTKMIEKAIENPEDDEDSAVPKESHAATGQKRGRR